MTEIQARVLIYNMDILYLTLFVLAVIVGLSILTNVVRFVLVMVEK